MTAVDEPEQICQPGSTFAGMCSSDLPPGLIVFGSAASVNATCCVCAAAQPAATRIAARILAALTAGLPHLNSKLFFDALMDFPLTNLLGDAYGVFDRMGIGAPMTDDTTAAPPEQRRAAVFGVV